ncbi:hypothetical protein MVEN_01641800 [Mycena venus]|uniref:Uncharacterized protein n=1 Tax=Mycena venus TaxID=2733690 RepID=A0A8H6XPI3_9AGAR|nr:hypothetical protein MVEN_01641800 [Mycena venus]
MTAIQLSTAKLHHGDTITPTIMSSGLCQFDKDSIKFLISIIQTEWALAASELCLYGGYFVLMAFYLHVLHTRGGMAKHRFLAVAIVMLFILCTIHCALVVAAIVLETGMDIGLELGLPGPDTRSIALSFTMASAIYVTTNLIADGIFIFRCYAIWNARLCIVLLPIFLTFAVAGVGYFNVIAPFAAPAIIQQLGLQTLFDVSVTISLFTTFVLMVLTVGRIWWLARAARQVMGKKVAGRYYTVCAMILESGALYFIGGLVFIVKGFRIGVNSTFTSAVLGQLAGIAPTIIAVRVGLGYSVESVDSFIVPIPRTRNSEHFKVAKDSLVDSWKDDILYIRPESVMPESA